MIVHTFDNFSVTLNFDKCDLKRAHLQITNSFGPPMSIFIEHPGTESIPSVDLWLDQDVHNITINQINKGPLFSSQPDSTAIPFDLACDLDPLATLRERREAIVKALLHHRVGRQQILDHEIDHLEDCQVICKYFLADEGASSTGESFTVLFSVQGFEVISII